jgi:hypothetical protein
MKLQKACEELVLQLMPLWPAHPEQSYYDEWLGMCHEHPTDNWFEIATNSLNHTTYYLHVKSALLRVHVKRLDNYKLHMRAKHVDATMDEQDWQQLHAILQRLVHLFNAYHALKTMPLKEAWLSLQTVLFSEPYLGVPPQKVPTLVRNPYRLSKTLQTTLKKAKRFAEFEWRDWDDAGVKQIQKMAPLKVLSIKLVYPTEAEFDLVTQSDDFYTAVLDWFDEQLYRHELTLIAIGPVDEFQTFGLVSNENIAALSAALKKLCIYCEMPSRYQNQLNSVF